MTYLIDIDEGSLEATAKALETLNPGRSSMNHMRSMVRANMWDGSTSMGTAGWETAGFFPDYRPGVMVVRFSVAAYTINKYLERLAAEAAETVTTSGEY